MKVISKSRRVCSGSFTKNYKVYTCVWVCVYVCVCGCAFVCACVKPWYLSGEEAWKGSWEVSSSWRLPYKLCGSKMDPEERRWNDGGREWRERVEKEWSHQKRKIFQALLPSQSAEWVSPWWAPTLRKASWTSPDISERKSLGQIFIRTHICVSKHTHTHTHTLLPPRFGWGGWQLLCSDPWWWQMQSSDFFGLYNYRHTDTILKKDIMSGNLAALNTCTFICVYFSVCVLTEQRSWWTSWAAALSCWAIHTSEPRTWPTAGPRCSAGAELRAPPCGRCQEPGWGCSTPAPAACGGRRYHHYSDGMSVCL